ncbi:MAG: hypothetical protein WCQ77_14660, partial [Planctomycetota bacterium]
EDKLENLSHKGEETATYGRKAKTIRMIVFCVKRTGKKLIPRRREDLPIPCPRGGEFLKLAGPL